LYNSKRRKNEVSKKQSILNHGVMPLLIPSKGRMEHPENTTLHLLLSARLSMGGRADTE